MDAWRDGEQIVVEFDLPGVDPDSVDLDVQRNVLTVRAERRPSTGDDTEMIAAERPRGMFSRQVILGDTLDTDRSKPATTPAYSRCASRSPKRRNPTRSRSRTWTPAAARSPPERDPMARHVLHRRTGEIDEYQELPDNTQLEPHFVTVTFPDGSLRSYHVEDGLGGVGFEFAEAGILVLRFEDSDHMMSAFAPTAWTSVSGTALSDRGRRSATGR
jgi:HSP20 family protein